MNHFQNNLAKIDKPKFDKRTGTDKSFGLRFYRKYDSCFSDVFKKECFVKKSSKMPSPACIFTLPLEIDSLNHINSEEETLLNVESESHTQKNVNFQGLVDRKSAKKRKSICSTLFFIFQMIKWHVLLYCVITSSLYAIFHFFLTKKNKKEVLEALSFLDDWRQLVFFYGIYLSYTVKKVGDVSAVSHKHFNHK